MAPWISDMIYHSWLSGANSISVDCLDWGKVSEGTLGGHFHLLWTVIIFKGLVANELQDMRSLPKDDSRNSRLTSFK